MSAGAYGRGMRCLCALALTLAAAPLLALAGATGAEAQEKPKLTTPSVPPSAKSPSRERSA